MRLIDAEQLKKSVRENYGGVLDSVLICRFIDEYAEPVDAEPVVHARWKPNGMKNAFGGIVCNCTNCGEKLIISPDQFQRERYCCFCGAKMDKEVNEDDK